MIASNNGKCCSIYDNCHPLFVFSMAGIIVVLIIAFLVILILLKSLFASPNSNKVVNEGPSSGSIVQKGSDAKIALEVTNENMRTDENPRELNK